MIKAKIVAHSLSPQKDELISVLCTFPRIILAEVNTHRMLSKNTSSSRAIPFKKMVKAVEENPFIPIAWQKEHTGMQGDEYIIDEKDLKRIKEDWLEARDNAVYSATQLNNGFNIKDEEGNYVMTRPDLRVNRVTKQLCNRLLEPFMWTTMLITGSREGWDNFFSLRCPNYDGFKSKKEASKEFLEKGNINTSTWSELDWLKLNKGQAEIHMMMLSEKIYDVIQESVPTQLKNEWHIPFEDKINELYPNLTLEDKIKVSVGMAANTSYTIVGDGSIITLKKATRIHDKCKELNHSSVFEHCARAMSDIEYESFYKGQVGLGGESGWCNNLKGFIPYRYMIDNNLI